MILSFKMKDRAKSSQNHFFFVLVHLSNYCSPLLWHPTSILLSSISSTLLELTTSVLMYVYSSAISTAIMRHSLADNQIVPADQFVEQHHDHLDLSVQQSGTTATFY